MAERKKAPRKTARIPDSQRRRPRRNLTLDPEADTYLDTVGNASEYVSQLILDDMAEKKYRE